MKFDVPQQIFEKYSNIEFHETPSSGSTDDPYGQTEAEAVSCLLGNLPASERLVPTFRNLLSVPFSEAQSVEVIHRFGGEGYK